MTLIIINEFLKIVITIEEKPCENMFCLSTSPAYILCLSYAYGLGTPSAHVVLGFCLPAGHFPSAHMMLGSSIRTQKKCDESMDLILLVFHKYSMFTSLKVVNIIICFINIIICFRNIIILL